MRRAGLVLLLIGCGASATRAAESTPIDGDHDGIDDAHDACPCEPEDVDDWMDDDGCPDWDDDEDRIPDACDRCPREAESYDGVCDEDGCSDASALETREPFPLLERVEFAEGSAEIRPEASSVLDDVVRAMNGHPSLGPLHVLGQLDAHEPHHEGLALSRAQAVVLELARRSLDPARMIAEVDPTFVTSDPHTLPRYVRFEVPQPASSVTCPSTLCRAPWTPPAPVCSTPSLDRDHDGVDDAHDVCPCHAEDHDGWQDGDGCPDPDNDGDHIVDACDQCPNDPETYQGNCDEDGCPDGHNHICVEQSVIQIVQYVRFARGSAAPLPESMPVLDAIASAMNEHPEITLVAVLGESDTHEPHHATLPLARAQAALDALVTRGVARERLVAEASVEVHPPTDPPEASRRVRMEVRQSGEPEPSSTSGCAPRSCDVRACEPPPEPPPAC